MYAPAEREPHPRCRYPHRRINAPTHQSRTIHVTRERAASITNRPPRSRSWGIGLAVLVHGAGDRTNPRGTGPYRRLPAVPPPRSLMHFLQRLYGRQIHYRTMRRYLEHLGWPPEVDTILRSHENYPRDPKDNMATRSPR